MPLEHEIVFGKTKVAIPKKEFNGCRHGELEMCEKIQLLKCAKCGELLTAWWFLKHHTNEFRYLSEQLRSIKCQIEMNSKYVENLKRDRSTLKTEYARRIRN